MEKLEKYRWPLLKGLTISLFFLYFYIKGRFFGHSELYSRLELGLGVYYNLLILYPLALASSRLLDERKGIALKIRLFSGVIFFFLCSFLLIIKDLESIDLVGINLEQELVKKSWTEFNQGGISTTLMHYLYFNIERSYLYKIVFGGIGVTSFILFTKTITDSIRKLLRLKAKYSERRVLRQKEEELRTKIKIKEEIDEKMALKKKKNLKYHEEQIQKEVEKFMKNNVEEQNEVIDMEKVKEKIESSSNEEQVISLEELMEYAKRQKQDLNTSKKDKTKGKVVESLVGEKIKDLDSEEKKNDISI